jgi:hypothetical protein
MLQEVKPSGMAASQQLIPEHLLRVTQNLVRSPSRFLDFQGQLTESRGDINSDIAIFHKISLLDDCTMSFFLYGTMKKGRPL